MYTKVDAHEMRNEDEAQDMSGYTGIFWRQSKRLTPISEQEFFSLLVRNNQLVDIMRKIKEID